MRWSYLIRRLLSAALVVFGVSTAVFFLSHLTGDPASLLLGPGATSEQVDAVNHQWGYDRPLPVQYVSFLTGALRGDFGQSLWQQRPALALVIERFPLTAQLGVTALALAVLIGIPTGVLAASRRGSVWDRLSMVVALTGQSMPIFWVGIMLVVLFAVRLQLLPSSGAGSFHHLILPAITLAAHSVGRLSRLTRSQMLEVLGQEYIRTARAKGVPERIVLYRHALKNVAGPLLTTVGIETGHLLGGAVVTEIVFAWPGMGQLMVSALFQRDFPLIQAGVLWVAVVFVTITTAVDLGHGMLNPRVKHQ